MDKPVNVLLDVLDVKHAPTPRRLDDFGNQLTVPNRLPALHDPHHCRLALKVAVRGNALVRLLVLLLCLLELHLVDLDAVFLVHKHRVDGKRVRRVDFARLWRLGQGSQFRACQGLESAFDFYVGCEGERIGRSAYLLYTYLA